MRFLATFVAVLSLLYPCCVRSEPVELEFVASTPEFESATSEYRSIWVSQGGRIIEALERYSGAQIPDRRLRVIVFEGVSSSGRPGGPLRLRASYAEPVKRATLSHELLHRYVGQVPGLGSCYPEIHDVMAVVLFELWSELWGHDFATEQAQVESARSERYRVSWSRALALSQAERRSEIEGIASCRPPTMRSSGPRGEVSMFSDALSARGRLTRR